MSQGSNKWMQTLGQQKSNPGSWRNLYASASQAQTGAFIDQSGSQQFSQNTGGDASKQSYTTGTQRSVHLLQPQEQSYQPHERHDSDEIELKDSEDGLTDNSDDCEFNSLEGNARPSGSRIPKT